MIKVAVLMSTYNGEKYLRDQIDSILNQNGNFELHLIIRDDGSTDGTLAILDEYRILGKLEWYKGDNLRTAKSFIDLLYNHPGFDFYAFSDQDDYWYEDKLENGIKTIKDFSIPCLYFCNAEYFDKNLDPLGGKTYNHKMNLDFYSVLIGPGYLGCTFVFNKELAEIIQNNRLPEIVSMHDSFLARVCVCVGGEILFDPDCHIKYRQHGNNVIGSTVGVKDAIKRRISTITTPLSITADEQSREIISIYDHLIDSEKLEWLRLMAYYKDDFKLRLKLAFSSKPKFISRNMKIVTMLTILLGNY